MPTYIVVDRSETEHVSLAGVEMTRSAKAHRRQLSSNIVSALQDYASAELVTSDAPVALGRRLSSEVVKLEEKDADKFRRDHPSMRLIADQPISLISPRKSSKASIQTVTAKHLWHLDAIGLKSARKTWLGSRVGNGVGVAVLDTGVQETHSELQGKIRGSVTFGERGTAVPQVPSFDTQGHGTHVAGLICGTNVGVAPGAHVFSAVMIPSGFGKLSEFVYALKWAANNPDVQVLNMSAGIRGWVDGMQDLILDVMSVGILPVIAVGNEGRSTSRSPGNYASVLTVGASAEDGSVASFSGGGTMVVGNQQYTIPDLVAPGKAVYSSVANGGYEAWDGTSMATPIVSGIAALVLERYPNITVTDLIDALLNSCKDLTQARERQGAGLINVKAAK